MTHIGGEMRGTVAKRLRREAYGDGSRRVPIAYDTTVSSRKRDMKGIVWEKYVHRIPEGHPRHRYKELKRAYKGKR